MLEVPETGVCANCGFSSAFRLSKSNVVWPQYMGNTSWTAAFPILGVMTVMTCLHCSKTSIYLVQHVTLPAAETGGEKTARKFVRQVYPAQAPRELNESVPPTIRSLFREASVCENAGALRGAAGLYRAAVDALCDEQGVAGGQLFHRLVALKEKAVSDQIVDDLHEARLLGNYSLHDGLAFSAEEVADVADLLVEATTELYVQPAERKRLRDQRKERRQDAKQAKP